MFEKRVLVGFAVHWCKLHILSHVHWSSRKPWGLRRCAASSSNSRFQQTILQLAVPKVSKSAKRTKSAARGRLSWSHSEARPANATGVVVTCYDTAMTCRGNQGSSSSRVWIQQGSSLASSSYTVLMHVVDRNGIIQSPILSPSYYDSECSCCY